MCFSIHEALGSILILKEKWHFMIIDSRYLKLLLTVNIYPNKWVFSTPWTHHVFLQTKENQSLRETGRQAWWALLLH